MESELHVNITAVQTAQTKDLCELLRAAPELIMAESHYTTDKQNEGLIFMLSSDDYHKKWFVTVKD